MIGSVVRKSPTVDEQAHLFRGVAYLKAGATHFLLGHPLFNSALSALPLLTEPDMRLPVDHPAWGSGDWAQATDAFLWQVNDKPRRIIFLARQPVIWLTLLLASLLFRWGRDLAGERVGLLATALLALDPNVLAHGRLVTSDVPISLFFTLAVYGFWRYAVRRGPKKGNLLFVGLGLGLAAASKFNSVLLLPILGGLGLALAWRRRSWEPVRFLVAAGLVAWMVIWLVYGLGLRPYPAAAYWQDFAWVLRYFDKPHGAFLAGQTSTNGWWYYFPAAFLVKTPLASLFLLGWAALIVFNRERWAAFLTPSALALWWPPALYFGFSLTTSLNIGYRHLLPVLPFLWLGTADVLGRHGQSWRSRAAAGTAVIGLLLVNLLAWPDYIPFFNRLVGGAENGWRILSDSNLDWGQDLPALAGWQKANGGEKLKLSYFGTAHPSAYGLSFEPLPTWGPTPEQGDPRTQAYNPADPAPGLYAISVNNLHGVVLGKARDTFAWFRDREPLARIGGSIFVYRVPRRGEPVDVVFSGLRPMDLPAVLRQRWGTNDVRPRWLAAESSFVWPGEGGWLATPTAVAPPAALAAFWPEPAMAAQGQSLYRLPAPPPLPWADEAEEVGGVVTFLGFRRLDAPPGEVVLMTAWRVEAETERPLKIFIHALDTQGQIVGQWDGLDVWPAGWSPGDVFVQSHRFAVSAPDFSLAAGMYDGETLVRLADPIALGTGE